ncbi:hypothetical protein [Klebsiella pneumoniae]|nr:hypothetical protein [Klebsiella pneumoniae]MDO7053902.1 hypothetical protein [Klebsiella pneumoniae]MDO7059405.1 hypothetical protein [Klebsiella pneumoniae]MDO7100040.1 hypothetical protein [Klebsiella pneumoniae]MDO7125573.1 hypothetical protein [Klebsiella pneumoniae]MDO7178084.1 hypothetical protein [Klebsiella pneumoniae]
MSGYINCQTIFAEKSKMLITSENSANSILEQLESAGVMAKKGKEKIVQEALLKGYTVKRSGDRFEVSKPGKK